MQLNDNLHWLCELMLNSFEVTVNDKLIFSKLKCGGFPDTEAIISELIAITNGETPKEVTKCKPPPECSIL
ncbi:unnamed protein product [Trichobilharzia szidati]|nr:unnamed protein product [Trichobilharzia szidati]